MSSQRWFPFLIAGVWLAIWLLACFAISRLGWSRLASRYPAASRPKGRRWRFQSAYLGVVRYRSCLTLTATPEGLHLAIWFPFRFMHRPILIPWPELGASLRRILGFGSVELTARQAPGARISVGEPVAFQIAQAAGAAWPDPGLLRELLERAGRVDAPRTLLVLAGFWAIAALFLFLAIRDGGRDVVGTAFSAVAAGVLALSLWLTGFRLHRRRPEVSGATGPAPIE